MKIADALLLQKDLAEETKRLREVAKSEGWEYRTTEPNSKWMPSFDLKANEAEVKNLSKLHRRLSRAISKANNSVDLPDIKDSDYEGWL